LSLVISLIRGKILAMFGNGPAVEGWHGIAIEPAAG
jgi:hypothetical protein